MALISHFPPRTPFATHLSRSARETELRIRSIFQWQKKRPPLWSMALVGLMILLCGSLVSCQVQKSSVQTPQANSPASDAALSSDRLKELTLPDGSQLIFRTEKDSSEASLDGSRSGLYRVDGTMEEWIADVPYGPGHPYWETVSLSPFSDIMGCSGFVLAYDSGAAWRSLLYYSTESGGYPQRIAGCYNTAWQADLNADGQMELLSNYHTSGYLDVHWMGKDKTARFCQLNESARRLLDLPPDVWVSLNALTHQEEGTVVAQWTQNGQSYTRDLALTQLWQWEQEHSSYTETRSLRTASGRVLTAVLEERKLEGNYTENWYEVTGIQAYDGETQIQAIDTAALNWPDPTWDGNGLYVLRGSGYMEPEVLDLNADGSEDLGVLCEFLPPKAPCFAWFLWDEAQGQLVLSALLSDFQLTSRGGTYSLSPSLELSCNFYTRSADGTVQLTRQEQPFLPILPDSSRPFVWAELYQAINGRAVYFGQVLQPEH